MDCKKIKIRDVAQFGSAPVLGTGGRRFKSCHPDTNQFYSEKLCKCSETVGVKQLSTPVTAGATVKWLCTAGVSDASKNSTIGSIPRNVWEIKVCEVERNGPSFH